MDRTLRWGLIGCGDVTEVKSGPALQRAVGSQLLRVASRRPEQAAAWARRHAVPHWHADIGELLAAPDIDAVYIATRPDSHCELTLRVAAAGKAVLVEKPMALDPAECEAMIAACRSAGVPLWVAYYRRALPRFLAIRELLAGEAIGALRAVHWRQLRPLPAPDRQSTAGHQWRVDPVRSGGGLFFEAACHALDALDFLLGPLEQVQGLAANQAGAWAPEDIVSATWRHGGDGPRAAGCWAACCGATVPGWRRSPPRSSAAAAASPGPRCEVVRCRSPVTALPKSCRFPTRPTCTSRWRRPSWGSGSDEAAARAAASRHCAPPG